MLQYKVLFNGVPSWDHVPEVVKHIGRTLHTWLNSTSSTTTNCTGKGDHQISSNHQQSVKMDDRKWCNKHVKEWWIWTNWIIDQSGKPCKKRDWPYNSWNFYFVRHNSIQLIHVTVEYCKLQLRSKSHDIHAVGSSLFPTFCALVPRVIENYRPAIVPSVPNFQHDDHIQDLELELPRRRRRSCGKLQLKLPNLRYFGKKCRSKMKQGNPLKLYCYSTCFFGESLVVLSENV